MAGPDPLSPVTVPGGGGPDLTALAAGPPAPAPGVVVVHGLGSRKENHADFAGLCAAAGMRALVPDLRGHGGTGGDIGPGLLDDVLAAVDALSGAGHARIGVRGSSLGGFLALHAAARRRAVRAVVAICPARPEGLARRLDAAWPLDLPLEPAVSGGDGVARGFWHATGDEQVAWGGTFALAGAAPHPKRLRIALGGGHRTLQHDPAVLDETVAFLAAHLT